MAPTVLQKVELDAKKLNVNVGYFAQAYTISTGMGV